jgi:serine/threonine-protein kinase HipA
MTSDNNPDEAFVWAWLPGLTEPVVAGRIVRDGERLIFNYGRSYLQRDDAIALYKPELPLQQGALTPLTGLSMAGCLRDAAPDAWGRRVIINRKFGLKGKDIDVGQLDDLTYLLESGSDRIGALDFQLSATDYAPRGQGNATFEELMSVAERVETGKPITADLDLALFHGSSIGGARPKAIIEDGARKLIAKFSSRDDVFNVVKGEFVAMRLASVVGINAAPVDLVRVAGKDVLLIERFDRVRQDQHWQRKAMVSALTLFELDEMMARYASYETLTEIIRHRFTEPKATLRELFKRLVFNILCGNTDDHARNHAAFWDGESLTLTPAYDICPQARAGGEAGQAMLITGQNNRSQLTVCLQAAPHFLLSEAEATEIIEHQLTTLHAEWPHIAEEAELTEIDRGILWGRQFLNPFAFEGVSESLRRLSLNA